MLETKPVSLQVQAPEICGKEQFLESSWLLGVAGSLAVRDLQLSLCTCQHMASPRVSVSMPQFPSAAKDTGHTGLQTSS